jgi:cytochrome c-type protein NapC
MPNFMTSLPYIVVGIVTTGKALSIAGQFRPTGSLAAPDRNPIPLLTMNESETKAVRPSLLKRASSTGEKTCIDCHKGIAHHLPDMRGVPGWQ